MLKEADQKRLLWSSIEAPPTYDFVQGFLRLSETLIFLNGERAKWTLGDWTSAYAALKKRMDSDEPESPYANPKSKQLTGDEIIHQLRGCVQLLDLCIHFSKKPFPTFLETAGFSKADVLLQRPVAQFLKPACAILRHEALKCFLILIRGTHSWKDVSTAATGALVPFHLSSVSGYAHRGMVAAAGWIAEKCTRTLINALNQNADYKVKIVGHSLGGGTAALLTYILREREEFAETTCVTFGPASCMTWDLAESGKDFITTIINGSDLVPTFSAASIDDLVSEVNASRSNFERHLGRYIENTCCCIMCISCCCPLTMQYYAFCTAEKVGDFLADILYYISLRTCMRPRRHVAASASCSKTAACNLEEEEEEVATNEITEEEMHHPIAVESQVPISSTETDACNLEEEEEVATNEITEEEMHLTNAVESQVPISSPEIDACNLEEEEMATNEITEEKMHHANAVETQVPISSPDVSNNLCFYPPGRILHIVSAVSSLERGDPGNGEADEEQVRIYETPRALYGELRLSRDMLMHHYMPQYKKMMEILIRQENEKNSSNEYIIYFLCQKLGTMNCCIMLSLFVRWTSCNFKLLSLRKLIDVNLDSWA